MSIENGATQPGVVLTNNESERFESRFVTVRINKSPSVMLSGMQNSVLGIWVAHGEGRLSLFGVICCVRSVIINQYIEHQYTEIKENCC